MLLIRLQYVNNILYKINSYSLIKKAKRFTESLNSYKMQTYTSV